MGAAIGRAHRGEDRGIGSLLMAETQNIVMPLEQEGSKSVVRAWLKAVGDAVKQDEPIVELETDKVAVEVPAPCDGVLSAIALHEGDEAAPGAVLGVLNTSVIPGRPKAELGIQESTRSPSTPWVPDRAPRVRNDERNEQRLSPLVKRLVAEHGLDIAAIAGTGRDGRITHKDVQDHVTSTAGRKVSAAKLAGPSGVTDVRIEIPHDAMRRSIAEHMTRSVAVAPHVTAVFEADFSAIIAHRAKHKDAYAKARAPLTYSAYIVRAAAEAMKVSPNVNARWHDDFLEVFEDVNIGMGVALGDKGLIVPVIKRAQALTLKETAASLGDVTERARRNQLKPADVQGGTFTISNHGVSGSLVATPIIINQPQSAILGVGKLEKRVVVREVGGADAMVIKPMAYVSLTIDHRVLDGHQTNAWLTRFVEILETWPLEETDAR
jgi:2-oxoglutarate dehydrogenase E2 component (dihydrolipoamide succinyltransferase)